MPSPFPRMDPYLEDPAYWQDFHRSFITYCRDALLDNLPDEYEARIDEQIRLIEYNEERPHESLRDLTPQEYLINHLSAENSRNCWA